MRDIYGPNTRMIERFLEDIEEYVDEEWMIATSRVSTPGSPARRKHDAAVSRMLIIMLSCHCSDRGHMHSLSCSSGRRWAIWVARHTIRNCYAIPARYWNIVEHAVVAMIHVDVIPEDQFDDIYGELLAPFHAVFDAFHDEHPQNHR